MKQKYPLVSVVMPTYNGSKTIGRALQSVLRQDYSNMEIFVVDDCSIDNTVEVVSRINDKRIHILKHKENKNGSAARNTGIRESNGKYIAFLDDDDEWKTNKISMQVKCLEERDPSIWKAVVVSHSILFNNRWRDVILKKEGDISKEILLMQISLAAGSSLLISKDAIDDIGFFNEKYVRHQDMEYVLRYLRKYKLATQPQPLSIIHGHSGKVSGDKLVKVKQIFLKDFKKNIESFGEKTSKKIYARQWLQVSKHYAMDGDIQKTFRYLRKSLSFALLFSERCKVIILENYISLPYYLLRGLIQRYIKNE